MVFQEQNRKEIRTFILRALGGIVGTATGGGDTASLIDTYGLGNKSDTDLDGSMVFMDLVAGVAATDKTWISTFTGGTTADATLSPVVSGVVAAGDTYEVYPRPYTYEDVNDAINRAIIAASAKMLVPRVTDSNFTIANRYEYDWLVPYAFGSDFKALYKAEYVYNSGVKYQLHSCDGVWDESVDSDVTASVDSTNQMEGSGCLKLVIAAGAAADDILATDNITSIDINDCNQIEIWIHSTVALDAGDLHLLLDDTASCASPLETLDIPATAANTPTRHVISLADPSSDVDIISVGIELEVDKGAMTLRVDDIVASLSDSKEYKDLSPEQWFIAKGDTPKFALTAAGKTVVGDNNQVRLSGYASPDYFSDDTTDCEIDPDFVIEWALAYLMLFHAKAPSLNIDNRQKLGELHLASANSKLQSMSTSYAPNTRFVE
jgi:hypothetical protein